MDKKQQFITMVQTAVITRYVCDPGDGSAPMARPMWSIQHMENAFAVAAQIPPDVTAREAAEAFVRWLFNQPLEPDDHLILNIILH
jgi:hypothetical protein